jgi:hypothetical protein
MYTLPHQCEFLSDDWLEVSRDLLVAECKRRGSELPPFSISEAFTDAPPHLKLAGNRATWQLSWDGALLNVSRGFNPKADLCVEGDYQAVLLTAQTVGMQAPGVMDAAMAEMRHWFGDDCLRMDGRIEDRAVIDLLSLHHDHMARKTVENPDLEHRARRQGLIGQIRQLEEDGYAIIERAITPAFADLVRESTIRAIMSHQTSSLNWMLYHGVEFEKIIQNPLLLTLIDATLGRGAVAASISSIKRGPGKGLIKLHNDYSEIPEPYPEFSMTGVGVWSFEDWHVASGPTWLVPGSHKLRRGPRKGETVDGVPIEMPKGSVVYFHHGVWHWQGDRTEPGERITLHSHFNRGILRSLEPKRVDVQLLHRNPPRLGEILGEDDWYDKMTASGRDYMRFNHTMNLNRFTDDAKARIAAKWNLEDRARERLQRSRPPAA